MSKTRLVSRKEAARELGITRQRLEYLIKSGKIEEAADGIDIEKAKRLRKANTDPAKQMAYLASRSGRAVETPPPATKTTAAQLAAADAGKARASRERQRTAAGDDGERQPRLFDFNEARTAREQANAKIAELNYQERAGQLIRREVVERREFAVARKLRDRLLGFPARVANFVAPEAMPTLNDEIEALIKEMAADAEAISKADEGL